MPDFQWVQSPFFTPTACVTCGTHHDKKGFVDLLVDDPVSGRLYMCVTCFQHGGKKAGMVLAKEAIELRREVSELKAEIELLHHQLEVEKNDKYVSLADAEKLIKAASV